MDISRVRGSILVLDDINRMLHLKDASEAKVADYIGILNNLAINKEMVVITISSSS